MTTKEDNATKALVALIDERIALAAGTAPPPVQPPVVTPPVVTPPVVTPPVPVTPPSAALLSTFVTKALAALDTMELPVHPNAAKDKDARTFASAEYWLSYYYDVTERCLDLYELTGNPRWLTAAKREGKRFRDTLIWTGDRCIVRYPSDDDDRTSPPLTYAPPQILEPALLRRNGALGQWRLFSVTGDLEAKKVALGAATMMLAAIPRLAQPEGSPAIARLEWAERNLAYAIAAINAGFKLDPARFGPTLADLVKRALAWNARSAGGNFEHNGRQDPAECWDDDNDRPGVMKGGSPFMTALLVYELHKAAGQDPGVRAAIVRASTWLAANRMRDVGKGEDTPLTSYRYLPGCPFDPLQDWKQDLNPMIAPVHELAFRISGDVAHRTVGDQMMGIGIGPGSSSYKGDPKHFSQLLLAAMGWLK